MAANTIDRLVGHKDTAAVMDDIHSDSSMFKFKGQGQKQSRTITYKSLLKLIMILPGVDPTVRTQFASFLERVLAGDLSLVPELVNNNQSNDDINTMARESAGVEQADPTLLIETTVNRLLEVRLNEAVESRVGALVRSQLGEVEETFRKRRRLMLNDARAEEASREKERKHELTVKKMEEQTKVDIAKEEVKSEIVKYETEEKIAVSREETKQEAARAKQELERTKQEKFKARQLELQLELRRLDIPSQGQEQGQGQGPVPPPSPVPPPAEGNILPYSGVVTISRVAEQLTPIDTLEVGFRYRFLERARVYATRELNPNSNKVLDIFKQRRENTYKPADLEKLRSLVQKAYDDERRANAGILPYLG